MNEPQSLRRGRLPNLIVSRVHHGKAAISADLNMYVSLTEREWRWLVEVAGPQVLAVMADGKRAKA